MEWITDPQTLIAFVTLVALEIVLGIDNVVFISILSGKLPGDQPKKARLVGLSLAMLMRIGLLCRSEYEYAAHHRVGRRAGMTDADIDRILRGPGSGGDPIDDALLRATDELHGRDAISAETWKALAGAFDTRQLFDIMIAVGGYRSTSMLINTAGVQLDANMADFRFPSSLR